MSKTFYVNLFHNGFFRYSGFKKERKPSENGGFHPVMVPTTTSLVKAVKRTAKMFPYRLTDENIRSFGSNEFEIAFLIPTENVPNLSQNDIEESLYYKLTGSDEERLSELRSQVSDLEDKLGKKNKKIRELQSEEEERNKGGSNGSRKSLRCPQCGASNGKSLWERNNGECPDCRMSYMNDPEVQTV